MNPETRKKVAEELGSVIKSLEGEDGDPLHTFLRKYWDGKIEGCYETKQLVSYYRGNEDEETGATIEAHVKECSVCDYDLGEIRKIGKFYAEDFNGDVPADFIERRRESYEEGLRDILAQQKERLATRTNNPTGYHKDTGQGSVE